MMSSEIHWNKDTDIEALLIQDYDPHEDYYPFNEIEYLTLEEMLDGNGETHGEIWKMIQNFGSIY